LCNFLFLSFPHSFFDILESLGFAEGFFSYDRKLRQISLAVLHCLDTRKNTIGEQLPACVARFFIKMIQICPCVMISIKKRKIIVKNGEFCLPPEFEYVKY